MRINDTLRIFLDKEDVKCAMVSYVSKFVDPEAVKARPTWTIEHNTDGTAWVQLSRGESR